MLEPIRTLMWEPVKAGLAGVSGVPLVYALLSAAWSAIIRRFCKAVRGMVTERSENLRGSQIKGRGKRCIL